MRNFTLWVMMLCGISGFSQDVVFEKFPQKSQIYQRNTTTNFATVPIRGTVQESAGFERVRLAISNEQGMVSETDRFLFFTAGSSAFNFLTQLPAERNNHQFTILGYKNGNWEMIETATDVLAGDIFIINGQSNAEANAAPDLGDVDPYTRSWFSPYDWGTLNLSFPGLWGARLAKVLSVQENLPIAIFNQAQGAVPITTFLPNENDIRLDNYGSLLKRFEDANIDQARAALWFHGETDAWSTPTEEYVTDFKKLNDAWVRDYGIERTFLFQMRFRSCQSPNPTILESHRRIGEQIPNTDVLSTLNANHDSCHFYYENGYKILAERMAKIMTNRFYGGNDPLAFSPAIDSAKISETNSRTLELTFKNDQPLQAVGAFPTEDFRLENTPVRITGGRVVGSKVELFLDSDLEFSSGVTYLGHPGGSPGWVTNTAGVGILTFNFFPIVGVEDRGVDLTCYADISVNGQELTVKDFYAPITAIKVLNNSFNAFFSCDQWGGTLCNLTEKITLPGPGKYYVRIQTFHDAATGICDVLQEIDVTGTNDPCQNAGGDGDGDGVCADEDCDDSDPNISQPGDACNDGNANTTNDVIQNDCTCRGTISAPCFANGGDGDGDGVCADEDCDDSDPNISQPGDACNDGNANTTNDVIQNDCTCRGTISAPCFANGGDGDGDGVCADEDCDDSDPNISQLGDACDDGNANTSNDEILADCSCVGVLLPPCFDAGGDADGDGVCGAEDCNDANPLVGRPGDSCNDGSASTENDILQADCSCVGTPIIPTSGCPVTYSVSRNEILIRNLTASVSFVKIMRSDFTTAFLCTSWDGSCSQNITFQTDAPGIYFLQIETHLDWSSPAECMIFEQIEITDDPVLCQNVTDGGEITGDQTICPGDNVSRIRSVSLPTGGNGTIEFRWLRSTLGCPNDLSETIPGEARSTYNPSNLTETTYFRRLSKRADCADWFEGESNCVVKTVDPCVPPPPTQLCNVEFSVSGDELTVTGMTDNIVTLRVSDEILQNDFYLCNDWTTPCDETFVRTFAPGIYYVGVQTFETWDEPLCDILEQFEITATGNRQIGGSKTGGIVAGTSSGFGAEELEIYPNPTSDVLNIFLPDFGKNEAEIRLTNSFGRTVRKISIDENAGELVRLSVKGLSPGIYSVWIFPEGEQPFSKRVLIQKKN